MSADLTAVSPLLIANRGEIACRVARTAAAMGIRTVGVCSDADAGALHTEMVDECVRLPGSASSDTYLRTDLLVEAAARTGARAIHPGYGFLSENAGFARACEAAGLVFVGPPAAAIEAMASKIAAKELMSAAGVPVLPGIHLTADGFPGEAGEVGFPLIVKAAFGGGGRGMRVVDDPSTLEEAVGQARREAASAFGDGTVFLERYVKDPRHIEVQVFADRHGNTVHLGERECSVQRRHQKVIEECPSPVVDDGLRRRLGEAAVAAARAIGYVGAGTVEFVMDPSGNFWFLEVNTRLQVEHPVTEMVTGLDLVRLQLEVAAGGALPGEALAPVLDGHAIEARLYAEDVPAGYLPAAGRLGRFEIPQDTAVRVDRGYRSGAVVPSFYDSLLAKVIAWAPTRDEAARRLGRALRQARLHGVTTNRALLVRVIESDDFRGGRIDTGFLDRHSPAELGRSLHEADAPIVHSHAAAALRIHEAHRTGPLPGGVTPGWRNVGGGTAALSFELDGERIEVPGRLQEFSACRVIEIGEAGVLLEHGGVRRLCRAERIGHAWYVDGSLGSTRLDEVPRFPRPESTAAPGSLVAPMPGVVTSVGVSAGETVGAGQVVVTVEAMKMEHPVRASHDGRVAEVRIRTGQQVGAGDVLVVMEVGDPPPAAKE